MKGEDARDRYFLAVEKEYEKEMAAIWRGSLDEIRVEMSKIYEKYSQGGLLTRAEMTRYNRLQALEKKIQAIIRPALAESKSLIKRLKPEEYGEAFFRTAWAFDDATGIALDWGTLDKNAVAAALENVFHEVAVKNWGQEALNRIRTTISNGLAVGQSYPDMMKDVKTYIDAENFKIMRILRTELHDAQEAGTAASYDEAKDMGVEGKVIWLSTLDGRTRDTHAEMDGVERDEDGMFRGAIGEAPYPGWEGLPPEERINCRCDMRFELDGYTPSKKDEPFSGEKYPDWKEDHKTWK
jgi:SPP1 gp7 family putative phage head morphogenesis protein